MLSVIRRLGRYLVAAITGKLDEMADPRVQIEQAIEEAKRRHDMLSQQAASVLGQQRELELKLGRSIEEVEKLQASARQALVLSEDARKAGDEAKTKQYEDTAQAFAMKLVAAEASMADLKALHDKALDSAQMARKAVEQNAFALQKQLAERSKLLSQLEQAKLQERMNDALKSMSELAPKGDVPTLNEVRDKIEARMLEVEKAAIDAQGAERLKAIRETLALEKGGE